jgi:hypothetical protein
MTLVGLGLLVSPMLAHDYRAGGTPLLPQWWGYAGSPQHDAMVANPGQKLRRIWWSTPVDLHPPYSGSYLLIHYGSPLVTSSGTVIVTVKVGTNDGFRVEGRRELDGTLLWTQDTDYTLPAHDWVPSCGSTLTPNGQLCTPGAGATVWRREKPDAIESDVEQLVFYGIQNFLYDKSTYKSRVKIDTPITSDRNGNLFFGFRVNGTTSLHLVSGLARIDADGTGSWVSAAAASGDSIIKKVAYNCAPALSNDGSIVYVAVNDGNSAGYLLGLDSKTLATVYKVRLKDVKYNADAWIPDDGTASPAIGPDGDVYYGVLDLGNNHSRGWMLHYDSTLTTKKTPGAFGWDDTASIVLASSVPPTRDPRPT